MFSFSNYQNNNKFVSPGRPFRLVNLAISISMILIFKIIINGLKNLIKRSWVEGEQENMEKWEYNFPSPHKLSILKYVSLELYMGRRQCAYFTRISHGNYYDRRGSRRMWASTAISSSDIRVAPAQVFMINTSVQPNSVQQWGLPVYGSEGKGGKFNQTICPLDNELSFPLCK